MTTASSSELKGGLVTWRVRESGPPSNLRLAREDEMRIRTTRKSTIVDKQFRFFVHRDIVKAMGLVGGGEIEWLINKEGQVAFRKAKNRKQRR